MTSAMRIIARGQLGRLDGPRGPGIPVVLSIEVADRRLAIVAGLLFCTPVARIS
jgi:hypothetical protein